MAQDFRFNVKIGVNEYDQVKSPHLHTFSIEAGQVTLDLPDPYAFDAFDTMKSSAKTNTGLSNYGDGNSVLICDDENHSSCRGWSEYDTSIIESVYWQLIYVTQSVIGYSLQITIKDDAMHKFSLAWIPLTVAVVSSLLQCSDRTKGSASISPVQEVQGNEQPQPKMRTVPAGESDNTSGRREQHSSLLSSNALSSDTIWAANALMALKNSHGHGGDRPPSNLFHTYNIYPCPVCQTSCKLRKIEVIYNHYDQEQINEYLLPLRSAATFRAVSAGAYHTTNSGFPDSTPQTQTEQRLSAEGFAIDSNRAPMFMPWLNYKQISHYFCHYPGCNEWFDSRKGLGTHMRAHTRREIFPCRYPKCGRELRTAHGRKCHELVHTGEKPLVCKYPGCDQRFPNGSCRRAHEDKCHPPHNTNMH